jgi:subtilase family serine protease
MSQTMKKLTPEKQAVVAALKKATDTLAFRNKVRQNIREENEKFSEIEKRQTLTPLERLQVYN